MVGIYIDQDALGLADLLRLRGHDTITAYDLGLSSASDAMHLLNAARQGKLLLTHNGRDFILLLQERELPMRRHISSITTKGQVTIPVEIRRLLGLAPHDKVAFLVEADEVRIVPAAGVVARTAGMLRSDAPRLSPQEEKVAAEEAMSEEAARRGG